MLEGWQKVRIGSTVHAHRDFPDLREAIEELMVASGLLRFLHEPHLK
jgi:hypothetical protein